MANTYRDEFFTICYPFAAGQTIPFPQSCITNMSVCVACAGSYGYRPWAPTGDVATALSALLPVTVTGVEISRDGVRATLCTGNGVHLGSIFCPNDGVNTTASEYIASEDTDYGAKIKLMMSIGAIPEAAYGTYATELKLDPSCVLLMPSADGGNTKRIVVNDSVNEVGENLNIVFDGYFTTTTATDTVFVVGAKIPDDAITTIQNTFTDKPELVTGVNGTTLPAAGTLTIYTSNPSAPRRKNIYLCVDPAQNEQNDDGTWKHGDVVILTITGTKNVRSCFSQDNDQAGEDPEILGVPACILCNAPARV